MPIPPFTITAIFNFIRFAWSGLESVTLWGAQLPLMWSHPEVTRLRNLTARDFGPPPALIPSPSPHTHPFPVHWHHVAMVWNGTRHELTAYYDGSPWFRAEPSRVKTGTLLPSGGRLILGQMPNGDSYSLEHSMVGGLDQVRLWSRPLSQAEVRSMGELARPFDCVLAPPSDWSECTVACGAGTASRTRLILVEGVNGGRPCEPANITQTVPCNSQPCIPVDCDFGSWSSWSSCDFSSNCAIASTRVRPLAGPGCLAYKGLGTEERPCAWGEGCRTPSSSFPPSFS